jgi:hypothetical protein
MVMPRLTERFGDCIVAAVLFLVGLSTLILSQKMPAGTFGEVGPGVFPTIISVILCLVSVGICVSNLWRRDGQTVIHIVHRNSWWIVGGLVITAILFTPVGALPMIGLYVLFLLKLLSKLGWIKCVSFAALTAAGGYVVFDYLLGIPLPGGIFF